MFGTETERKKASIRGATPPNRAASVVRFKSA
jgi:hypothetical protein